MSLRDSLGLAAQSRVWAPVGVACLSAMLATAPLASAQTAEEQLISKLAVISADADRRTATFMSQIAPLLSSLKLHNLSTTENLLTRDGRVAIRAGYSSFSKIIDDMDAFDRAEEARVADALSEATSALPRELASEVQAGYKRGAARTSAKHSALRAAQRQSIQTTLELVEVVERSKGGISKRDGRMVFADPDTQRRVSRLFSELGRLEAEERRLEQEIAPGRGGTSEARP